VHRISSASRWAPSTSTTSSPTSSSRSPRVRRSPRRRTTPPMLATRGLRRPRARYQARHNAKLRSSVGCSYTTESGHVEVNGAMYCRCATNHTHRLSYLHNRVTALKTTRGRVRFQTSLWWWLVHGTRDWSVYTRYSVSCGSRHQCVCLSVLPDLSW
jgi:hypothetical protein